MTKTTTLALLLASALHAQPRTGTADIQIGGAREDRIKYSFALLSGVTMDAAGRVFAVDQKETVVRVYSPAGVHLFDIGREGMGPGEFNMPMTAGFDRTGQLWVRDGGRARFLAFTVSATGAKPTTEIPVSSKAFITWAPVTFDPAGRVIEVSGSIRSGMTRAHLDANGRVMATDVMPKPAADSAPIYTATAVRKIEGGENTSTYYSPAPFGGRWLTAHSPTGEWATATTSGYAVAWMGADGKRLRVVTRTIPPAPPLTAADRAEAARIIGDFARAALTTPERLEIKVPDRKAPLEAIGFDLDGRLWVERAVATGARRMADVFARDGAYITTVTWPADVVLVEHGAIRGWAGWGIATDSLGVTRLVHVTFKP